MKRSLSDEREQQVVRVWRDSHRTEGTIRQYLGWVRRFRAHCRCAGRPEAECLTAEGVEDFAGAYRGPRLGRPCPARTLRPARAALFAWWCALRTLGEPLAPWKREAAPAVLAPLIAEYVAFRRRHRGVADGTLRRDVATAQAFLRTVREQRRDVSRARVRDVDRFVLALSGRLSRSTVADSCSSLRAFLRFLQVTGRLAEDLGAQVVAPRARPLARPPRAMPWREVRRLLRSVSRDTPRGRRDYAVLLLMATYGLGSAEVVGLRASDIRWKAGVLSLRRPKTSAPVVLPLLPAVARALATYLRTGRPLHVEDGAVFRSVTLPHRPLSTSAVRHLVRFHARQASLRAPFLGAHALRHSHATRQVEMGAAPQVVSDILGHRRPSSTSAYVRVALGRLRGVGLAVPR